MPRRRSASRFSITAGADTAGRPSALAKVVLTDSGSSRHVTAVEGLRIAGLEQLYDETGECQLVPGLFLAVEGLGSNVAVNDIETAPLECVNPSQFSVPATDAPVSAAELGWGDWSAGGVAAPALVTRPAGGTTFQWHVLADGTHEDRTLDPIVTEFGYAIGHSVATNTTWDSFRTVEMPPPSRPRFGNCTRDTCAAPTTTSVREPSAVVEGAQLIVAYAVWLHENTYGIGILAMNWDPTGATGGVGTPLLEPGDFDCDSLRDPALFAKPGGGYHLLFTCEKPGGRAEIHGVQIADETSPYTDHVTVLAPEDAAPYGAGAVRAPEVVVEVDPDEPANVVYRMWFTAQPRGFGESTIAVATAQSDGMTGDLPPFVPYPANPVLTNDQRALGPSCVDCQILGIAVTPRPRDRRDLPLPRGTKREFTHRVRAAPLEQFWRPPW